MPHFLYQAVAADGSPASGAMEADNAQAAHGKLVMAGYRQIQILSNRTTAALQDDLDAMSPGERQETARARVRFMTAAQGSGGTTVMVEVARRSWIYLLCFGALAAQALASDHPLRAWVFLSALAAPFLVSFRAGGPLRDYRQLQLAMAHGDWAQAQSLIARMRRHPANSTQLAMDLDVREAQIRARAGEPIATVIESLSAWRDRLADQPGTFDSRLVGIYLAARDYPGYRAAARASYEAAPEDATRAIELATAEARFGDLAETRRLLDGLNPALVTPLAVNYVNWCRGMIALREGDPAGAEAPLRAASTSLQAVAKKLPVAETTLALVNAHLPLALARSGQGDEARQRITPFWPQLDLFADAGLRADLEREVGRSPYQ